jgi:hypothetical protein
MLANLNHAVPFLLAITIGVLAVAHLLAFLADKLGLGGLVAFFSL